MNLCSWCPQRHDKAIRDIRRAVKSPCPGILTAIYIAHNRWEQSAPASAWHRVILTRNIVPLFFLLCLFYSFFFPIDLRLTCVCVVIGTTRCLCRRPLFFMILLYRRLLWHTGDIVKKIPITLYHRLIPGEHKMTFSRRSLHFITLSSINCWRTQCIDQQQQQSPAQFLQPHNKAFGTLLPW